MEDPELVVELAHIIAKLIQFDPKNIALAEIQAKVQDQVVDKFLDKDDLASLSTDSLIGMTGILM
jgi:hypothetical protein